MKKWLVLASLAVFLASGVAWLFFADCQDTYEQKMNTGINLISQVTAAENILNSGQYDEAIAMLEKIEISDEMIKNLESLNISGEKLKSKLYLMLGAAQYLIGERAYDTLRNILSYKEDAYSAQKNAELALVWYQKASDTLGEIPSSHTEISALAKRTEGNINARLAPLIGGNKAAGYMDSAILAYQMAIERTSDEELKHDCLLDIEFLTRLQEGKSSSQQYGNVQPKKTQPKPDRQFKLGSPGFNFGTQ